MWTDESVATDLPAKEKELEAKLTDEFLSTLVEAARVSGWSHDYSEITEFVFDMFNRAGKPLPDLAPYRLDDD